MLLATVVGDYSMGTARQPKGVAENYPPEWMFSMAIWKP